MGTETGAWLQIIVLIAQTIVLAMTAYFIWRYTKSTEKYTIETAALRNEAVRQTKISLRPIVLPQFEERLDKFGFRLSNYGSGCAININVKPVRIEGYKDVLGVIELRSDSVNYLASGDSTQVNLTPYSDGARWKGSEFKDWLNLAFRGGQETVVEITFGDIEGARYTVRTTISASDATEPLRKVKVGTINEIKESRPSNPV
jgi:hypothetical protein